MWVRIQAWPVAALVSLSKTLVWSLFGPVCCVMHVKEPRTLIVKEKGLGWIYMCTLLYYYYTVIIIWHRLVSVAASSSDCNGGALLETLSHIYCTESIKIQQNQPLEFNGFGLGGYNERWTYRYWETLCFHSELGVKVQDTPLNQVREAIFKCDQLFASFLGRLLECRYVSP